MKVHKNQMKSISHEEITRMRKNYYVNKQPYQIDVKKESNFEKW